MPSLFKQQKTMNHFTSARNVKVYRDLTQNYIYRRNRPFRSKNEICDFKSGEHQVIFIWKILIKLRLFSISFYLYLLAECEKLSIFWVSLIIGVLWCLVLVARHVPVAIKFHLCNCSKSKIQNKVPTESKNF